MMGLFESLDVMPSCSLAAGLEHMAQDELLLVAAADTHRPVFRSYRWAGHTVTFGYFQSLSTIEASFPDQALTRRWTGGGAVLHGDACEFTYALAVPATCAFFKLPASESYLAIHEGIARSLQAVGVAARMASREEASDTKGLACFQNPVAGDVLLGETDEKVAGAAQRRTRNGLLIQGSIRLPYDIPTELETALAEALGTEQTTMPAASSDEIADLVEAKYGRTDWLARKP